MGQSTDQTVRAIEDTRERLGEEIAEFEGRVQQRAATSRRALIPVAGAVAAAGAAWLTVRTIRRRAARKTKPTLPAKVLGTVLPERITESISETLENDGWKLGLAAAGGIWVLVRMAELRQLRRLNRTLVVR
ncbi:MAG TPA: hypothetical protein VF660_07130 [Actinomycetota bacterium]